MKTFAARLTFFALLLTPACGADNYVPGADSLPQAGVPAGDVQQLKWESKLYPGTTRSYWVYVPKQYDAARPACLMVFQDGGNFVRTNGDYRATTVLDNLIHKKEIPVTIGLFIDPGSVPPAIEGGTNRNNRSFEYDSLGDLYARFLIEEMIPELGKKWNITKDPEGRGLIGASSGGIAAFTVAWERPDEFRRVISYIGSFTNIRGGNVYPSLIRKTEKKPLHIFLQDGSNDLDNVHGNWPLANQEMAASLKYMKYDYNFVLGEGSHSGKHGGSILPDALRWLWRDYKP